MALPQRAAGLPIELAPGFVKVKCRIAREADIISCGEGRRRDAQDYARIT
jgi:hypothetical protein